MKKITRRSFLAILGAASAAGLLSACGAASSAASSAAASTASAAASSAAASSAASGSAAADMADVDPYTFLTDKKIGVQLGTTGDIYIGGDISDKKLGNAELQEFNKGDLAIQALLSGKIDAVVIDDQVAQKFVDANDGKLAILPTEYTQEEYAICLKKGSELTSKFNEAIAARKSDGTLDNILAKYIDGDTTAAGYVSDKTSYANGKLVMATNAYFQPYEYYDGTNIVGVDPEFAKAICDTMDYDLEIADMEFDSIIVAVNGGKADFGMAGMTVTEDRKKNVDFTDAYATAVQSIVYKK